ncbi:MAG: TRAP transporter large permease [Spirochaetaceae bacterium]|nr:MAG: TRAP transporter large permease [Spirochaetaceae bacterium]
MEIALVILFVGLIAIGVPIAFSLGIVAYTGIALIPALPRVVVFVRMFHGLNSFVLLAVPLFILAANIMNQGKISQKLINFSLSLVGHIRGGLAHANILVSMFFAGVSGSSQADTAGVGKILIPSMEESGYDKETAVGVTAASSTIGSIIPPSIVMVVYAGISNTPVSALFLAGIVPGVLVGLSMMAVVYAVALRKNFPKVDAIDFRKIWQHFKESLPALLTPVIIVGGIVTGFYTATEAAAFACLYALIIGLFVYKTIRLRDLPTILIDTLKLSSLSLFALATASALGQLMAHYQISRIIFDFFSGSALGTGAFVGIIVLFFLFIGTFMDGIPAMILFVPVILPSARALGIDPVHLGIIVTMTLSMGLVTPPYGLCLLIAASISNITIERAFRGTLPYFMVAVATLLLVAFFPDIVLTIPRLLMPSLF